MIKKWLERRRMKREMIANIIKKLEGLTYGEIVVTSHRYSCRMSARRVAFLRYDRGWGSLTYKGTDLGFWSNEIFNKFKNVLDEKKKHDRKDYENKRNIILSELLD